MAEVMLACVDIERRWDAIVAREEKSLTELLAVAPVTEFVRSIFCLPVFNRYRIFRISPFLAI
jgi:hypothetical protein